MRLFRWLCATDIPPGCDLRRCGWRLSDAATGAEPSVALAHLGQMDRHAWARMRHVYPRARHGDVLLLGVTDGTERARLLALGFGDALGEGAVLAEIAARADRIAARGGMLPRRRELGPLRLDLLARDGFVEGKGLALHPREFALLWRLADTPGVTVAKSTLIADVWRLCHMPDTNSLAVHVFRLRAKLAAAGLTGLVQTAATGGYVLVLPKPGVARAIPLVTADSRMHDLIIEGADTGVAIGAHRHEL